MGDSYNFSSLMLSALITGLACNLVCSPIIHIFLMSNLVSQKNTIKNGVRNLLIFGLGKFLAYTCLTIIAFFIGLEIKKIFFPSLGHQVNVIISVIILLTGMYYITKGFKKIINSKKDCENSDCNKCSRIKKSKNISSISTFGYGFVYGLTPCVPLISALTIVANIPLAISILYMFIFNIVSLIAPLFFGSIAGGILSKKIHEDLPSKSNQIQVGIGIILVFIAGYNYIKF